MNLRNLLLATLFCVLALPLFASNLPPGFIERGIASGLQNPTAMEMAPDGRIFICEQQGTVRVVKNDHLLSTPFLTVTVNSQGERGLLGIAFDPSWSNNHFVYILYTATTPTIHNRLLRVTADGDVMLPGSEVTIFDLNTQSATNHVGGAIHFGLDRKLYIASGDNAVSSNAQSLNNLFGKILRINKNGTIPSDNPFFTTTTGNNRAIWTLGLRNPFTFSIQRGVGRMFINDVGESMWEEINDGLAGSNYGWPAAEGEQSCGMFTCPLFAYGHGGGDTQGCAITGGSFYNPRTQQFPASYAGKYFFADFCNNWIRLYDPDADTASGFATSTIANPVDIKISSAGSLYYLARGSSSNTGELRKIRFTGT